MPLYERRCNDDSCGKVFELLLFYAEREDPQPCPECQGPTHRVMLPSYVHANTLDPVVVYRAKDGSFRYPGSTSEPTPSDCERVELRTFGEIDAFTRTVNQRERSLIEREVEKEHAWIAHQENVNRRELRSAMEGMNAAGRAFARVAMEHNNQKRPKSFDPNFYVEAREFSSSNRDAFRDGKMNRGRK